MLEGYRPRCFGIFGKARDKRMSGDVGTGAAWCPTTCLALEQPAHRSPPDRLVHQEPAAPASPLQNEQRPRATTRAVHLRSSGRNPGRASSGEAAITTRACDVIILGSGQAAGPLATALQRAGQRTALVEAIHVGGTCINEGCTPTKTMVASARVAYLARRAADYGVRTGPVDVDITVVRRRKRDIVDKFRNSSTRAITSAGVELVTGEACFIAPHGVVVRSDVEDRELSAPVIVINVGARPAQPPIPGLDAVPALNSTTIMELDHVPEHLLVLGGGYIGIEFGQMFRRFGSRVTLLERGPRLLTREDEDVAEAVAAILREDGLDIHLDTDVTSVRAEPGGAITVTTRSKGGQEETHSGSHLLVATGRVPNTGRLGLAVAGVRTDERGFIAADARLRTNVPGIYAVGDVKPGPAFTHISYDDFRILRTNLVEGGDATITNRLVPYCVFMDPQLAGVGLREEEARAQGRNVRIARLRMDHVARAEEVAEPRGFMKAVVDADTDRILGFTVLGIEGGEIMGAMEIAVMCALPYTALRDAIFAHPTLMESFNNLFASLS
jgi:pyruvate/2-oxoglutarate dehydrogenase complex dihydrolipoamide dehydrogenase (E3) component